MKEAVIWLLASDSGDLAGGNGFSPYNGPGQQDPGRGAFVIKQECAQRWAFDGKSLMGR